MTKVFYKPGGYVCRITRQYLAKSVNKGTDAFVLEFRVLKSVDDPRSEVISQTRIAEFWLTYKTVVRVRSDLQLLGWTGSGFSELDPDSPDHVSLVGWEVTMYCRHREDQEGHPREEWSPRGSSLQPSIDKRQIKEFDAYLARLDAQEKQKPDLRKSSNRRDMVPAAEEQPGITDDDVPF
jgi:hypothetical protein